MAAIVAGAVLGCVAGYFIGGKFGPRVFASQDARYFKPEYVTRAELFFARYGWLAVVLARFVPVVRTLVPTMAGVSRMPLAPFTLYNILGAILWGVSVPALGYFLGDRIPTSTGTSCSSWGRRRDQHRARAAEGHAGPPRDLTADVGTGGVGFVR